MKKIWSVVIYGKGKAMKSVCELLEHFQISYTQMDDTDADQAVIKKSKIIIATPGIKPSHRLYTTHGKKIMSELSFVGKLINDGYITWRNNIQLIGITGTNGKSTTTRVLYQACKLLEEKKELSDRKNVYIGWNFDLPLSGILLDIMREKKTEQHSIIILEASSFMLWKLQHLKFSVWVLLNIAQDHIDRHGSMKDYLQSKLNILVYADSAITISEIKENVLKDQMRWISLLHRLRPFWWQTNRPINRLNYGALPDFHHPLFLWSHNAYNFGAVDMVLQQLYGDYDHDILQQIQPVAHRLQPILLTWWVTIIDDSVSSSAHALGAALESMQWPIVLISWWYDNGENYSSLIEKIADKVKVAIFYGQTRVHLYPLAKQVVTDTFMVETLQEAMKLAWEEAKKHHLNTILYSPGAKSFDQFENVYERIATFEKLVEEYR